MRAKIALLLLLAVAVSGAILWGLWPVKLAPYYGPKQPTHGYSAGGSACQPERLAKLRGARAAAQADRCGDAAEKERIDTTQLEETSRGTWAAEQTVWVGIRQARVAVVQAVVLALALVAAGWAAWEAMQAAQVAKRVVTDLERPWLVFMGAEVERRERPDEPIRPNYFWVRLKFKNVGRMPAVVNGIDTRVIDKTLLGDIPDYTLGTEVHFGLMRIIVPMEEVFTRQAGAPQTPIPKGGSPPIEYAYFGRVQYDGLISAGHETGFVFIVSPHMVAIGNFERESAALSYYR